MSDRNATVELVARLLAVADAAKDLHYLAKGKEFFGVHQMADEVGGGMHDFCDSLKELCFVGDAVPPASEFLEAEAQLLEKPVDMKDAMRALMMRVMDASRTAADFEEQEDEPGVKNVLGDICQSLRKSTFFLTQSMADDDGGEGENGAGSGLADFGGEGGGDDGVGGGEGPSDDAGGLPEGDGGGEGGGEDVDGEKPEKGALHKMFRHGKENPT